MMTPPDLPNNDCGIILLNHVAPLLPGTKKASMADTSTDDLLTRAEEEMNNGSCQTAYKLLQPLLAEQNPAAQFLYASFSIVGTETVEEFEARRIRLLQSASEAGYARAMYALAVCLDAGVGIDRDPNQAWSLFRKSAEAGYSGMDNMGYFHSFLYRMGGLHDSVITCFSWLPDKKRIVFSFEDIFSNFEGLPEYLGKQPGRIILHDVSELSVSLERVDSLRVFEFLPSKSEPDDVVIEFWPSGKIHARFSSVDYPSFPLDVAVSSDPFRRRNKN